MKIDPDWWKELFDELYLQTDARSIGDEQLTCREVDFLEEVFQFAKTEPILDLCGGQGRHALELSRRGFRRMVLLDYSETLVRMGQRRAQAEGLNAAFIRGDARAAAIRSRTFPAVVILGSSFGYFIDEAENRKILTEVLRLLKPGGQLLMDLPDRKFVLEHFQPMIRHRIIPNLEVIRVREVTDDIVYCRETVTSRTEGCIRERTYCMRLYEPTKITHLLRESGFDRIGIRKGFMCRQSEGDFGTMTRRVIVTARKPSP
jgi:D-alanine-D-alanine ligase